MSLTFKENTMSNVLVYTHYINAYQQGSKFKLSKLKNSKGTRSKSILYNVYDAITNTINIYITKISSYNACSSKYDNSIYKAYCIYYNFYNF